VRALARFLERALTRARQHRGVQQCVPPAWPRAALTCAADALIYPGLGFGAVLARSRALTDTMVIAGARRLAALAPALRDPDAALLPAFGDAPAVNLEVAVAVAEQAIEEGSAGVEWGKEEVRERAKEMAWVPLYGEYQYDPQGES
jgi:malate dehydrogenase (oxaloacetate-decarboxylating)